VGGIAGETIKKKSPIKAFAKERGDERRSGGRTGFGHRNQSQRLRKNRDLKGKPGGKEIMTRAAWKISHRIAVPSRSFVHFEDSRILQAPPFGSRWSRLTSFLDSLDRLGHSVFVHRSLPMNR